MVILLHFLPLSPLKTPKIKILKIQKNCWRYQHFTHVYQKSQSHEVWFLRYGVRQTIFYHYGPLFALLPHNNPKNQKFQKLKKDPGDIIILHKRTKNHDHMLYYSLDMTCNRFNCYFSFWAIFYFFP